MLGRSFCVRKAVILKTSRIPVKARKANLFERGQLLFPEGILQEVPQEGGPLPRIIREAFGQQNTRTGQEGQLR